MLSSMCTAATCAATCGLMPMTWPSMKASSVASKGATWRT
jgi:hypothetical protein